MVLIYGFLVLYSVSSKKEKSHFALILSNLSNLKFELLWGFILIFEVVTILIIALIQTK